MMKNHQKLSENIIMILKFQPDRTGQTVQTQIRLLLEKHSDLDLHFGPLCLNIRLIVAMFSGVKKFRNFR